jgi:hypothetical protein
MLLPHHSSLLRVVAYMSYFNLCDKGIKAWTTVRKSTACFSGEGAMTYEKIEA